MSIISSLFNLIKAVVKSVFRILKDIFKKFWWIILIIAVIYCMGPAFLVWLSTVGAPAWLVLIAETVVYGVIAGVTALGALFAYAWTTLASFAATWSMSTWSTVLTGIGMLLAPEETLDFIGEVIDKGIEIGGDIIDAIMKSKFGTYIVLGLGGYIGWKLLTKPKRPKVKIINKKGGDYAVA